LKARLAILGFSGRRLAPLQANQREGTTIAAKRGLRLVAQVLIGCIVALLLALLVWRLAVQGIATIFLLSEARLDLIPLFVALILLGAAMGKKWLKLSVQVVLIGVVFYFLARAIHEDWSGITEYPWNFELPWLLLSIVFFSMTYSGHAVGWLLILNRFGQSVPFLPGAYVWFKSILARYVPGNVLMVVGRIMMIQPYGVAKRISLTSIVYEQALLVVSATIVLSVALPFWPDLRELSDWIWLVLIVPPLAVILLHPAVMGRLGNFALVKMGREPIDEFLPFRTLLWLIVFYCIFWVTTGAALFAMARSVTDQISVTDLPITIASVPLAWLVSLVFFISPSGLGIREGVYAYTMRFAFDSEGVASAFSILARFWQTLIEIAFVFVTMGIIKLWYEKHEKKEIEPHEMEAKPAVEGKGPPGAAG
jgi:uncharacterized membrane protein YbhN (UPF0104 family)